MCSTRWQGTANANQLREHEFATARIAFGAPIAGVRRAATRHIKEMIDLVARHLPGWGQPGAHERALVTLATAVGALVLARAVDDPRLSDALREAALSHLSSTTA